MTDFYKAAEKGDLERVTVLVGQGVDKNQVGGDHRATALYVAAMNNHFAVVQYLVDQGADIEILMEILHSSVLLPMAA